VADIHGYDQFVVTITALLFVHDLS